MTWYWTVTSPLGRARGVTGSAVRAADWVELLLTRSPGMAEAEISGPPLSIPIGVVSRDGVIRAREDDHGDM